MYNVYQIYNKHFNMYVLIDVPVCNTKFGPVWAPIAIVQIGCDNIHVHVPYEYFLWLEIWIWSLKGMNFFCISNFGSLGCFIMVHLDMLENILLFFFPPEYFASVKFAYFSYPWNLQKMDNHRKYHYICNKMWCRI